MKNLYGTIDKETFDTVQVGSMEDLLSMLIGGKNAQAKAAAMAAGHPSVKELADADLYDYRAAGLTSAEAIRIKSALTIAIRYYQTPERARIHSPQDAADLLMPQLAHAAEENFVVIELNARNVVADITYLYKGSVNGASIRVGEVYRHAIKINAANIIVAHNHPSGDPTPSPEDIAVTRAIREAGKLLDIALFDHVIIGCGRFVSLKEKGLGFS